MAEERYEKLTPNTQMGIIVVVTSLLYLFFGLSGDKLLYHSMFYLIMFFGAIMGGIIVYRDQVGDKLHFTTKRVAMMNVILYGVVLGLMMATLETFTAGGTIFIQQSAEQTGVAVDNLGTSTGLLSGIVFIGLFSFITANAEETLTRGFFNSVAENYSDSSITRNISKYLLIPLIFSFLHFFMWTSTGLINIGGFAILFLIVYHFVFGFVCQVAMDVTGSIYTPIAIHTIYNSVKISLALGIIAIGV